MGYYSVVGSMMRYEDLCSLEKKYSQVIRLVWMHMWHVRRHIRGEVIIINWNKTNGVLKVFNLFYVIK